MKHGLAVLLLVMIAILIIDDLPPGAGLILVLLAIIYGQLRRLETLLEKLNDEV
jgi:hypothetical protein